MGYTINLYKIIKPQLSDITRDNPFVWKLDSETKKCLLELGLKDKMIKIAGNYFIGLEEVVGGEYVRRFDQQWYNDYWDKEIRNPSIRFGWDVILYKARLEEICNKYISESHLKECFRNNIIEKHVDGQTIVLRI